MVATLKTAPAEVLRELFARAAPDVAFRLPDGTLVPDALPRRATVALRDDEAVMHLLTARGEKELAEAFLEGEIEIEGDLETALQIVPALRVWRQEHWPARVGLPVHWAGRTGRTRWHALSWTLHSRARDRRAVTFHYDVSNDFYRLWLDRAMVYSCGYFERGDEDLDTAQAAKLALVCRKLRLRPGQRVLDIGCGWGGFARYAAREYEVTVTGVTLSEAQANLAQTFVAADGLAGRVEIRRMDYRDLPETEPFDAIVSIGMSEHVGRENLPAYFAKVGRLLKPGGLFLNQAIGEGVRKRAKFGASFIDAYVFPDSDIPPLDLVLGAADGAGLEARDVENLREHYALTLREWRWRLEAAHAAALRWVEESRYRTWRLYLAASARGFDCGELAVHQVLFARPTATGHAAVPLTRREWMG